MKIVIVAGAPSSGKTSIVLNTALCLKQQNIKCAIVKMDCINSNDQDIYSQHNFDVCTGLSQDMCPDHFLAINLDGMYKWAASITADTLIVETAGLCNRCAPFIRSSYNVCVIDATASIRSPEKLGPMVTTADSIVFTKTDMISQIERQILISQVKKLNENAKTFIINGYTGAGCQRFANNILKADNVSDISQDQLKYDMPSAICSYCVGERRIGSEFHQGITDYMQFG